MLDPGRRALETLKAQCGCGPFGEGVLCKLGPPFFGNLDLESIFRGPKLAVSFRLLHPGPVLT